MVMVSALPPPPPSSNYDKTSYYDNQTIYYNNQTSYYYYNYDLYHVISYITMILSTHFDINQNGNCLQFLNSSNPKRPTGGALE